MNHDKMPKIFQTYWFGEEPIPKKTVTNIEKTDKDEKWQTFISTLKTAIQSKANKNGKQ